MSEPTDQQVSVSRQFLKALRWPAVLLVVGVVVGRSSTGTTSQWLAYGLWLSSLPLLIGKVVGFFRGFGVRQSWLGAILAIPGWIVASIFAILAIHFLVTALELL